MKTTISDLAIPELKMKFCNREFVSKVELREFYQLQNQNMTEQAFRRILYSLEKEGLITPIGAGIFVLLNQSPSTKKKKFIPNPSKTVQTLSLDVKENFLYTKYLLWETRSLHEFMTHQPGQNLIILEIEKEATESVFNKLKEQSTQNIFLEPDKMTIERYVINSPESILLLPMITQSPKVKSERRCLCKVRENPCGYFF